MKKLVFYVATCACIVLSTTSCSTISRTASAIPVETEVRSKSNADLMVSQKKISFTYKPTKAVRRGGDKNVIRTAVAEALKANGNADVIVGMQYEMKKTRNFFGHSSVKYVTVEGYPASYVNIKPAK